MDSEHRHELQENVLAHWLQRQIESLKPKLPLVLLGVVAIGVGVGALGLTRSSAESSRYASWDGFAVAMERGQPNMELLDRVSQDHEGTPSGEWAAVTRADGRLYLAAQQYLINRQAANESIAQAREAYQQLRGSSDARIRNRAVFGLARLAELSGELEEASELYGRVTGAFTKVAEDRIEKLAIDDVKDDYRWLATAVPVGRRPAAGAGLPSTIPDFTADAIETPDDAAKTPAVEEEPQTGDEALDYLLQGIGDESADTESAGEETASDESNNDESENDGDAAEDSDSDAAADSVSPEETTEATTEETTEQASEAE